MTQLTLEQQTALTAIIEWLADPDEPFFVLRGFAGTGKTYSIKELVNQTKGRFIFTAPTNKATKVIRESVTQPNYQPECRTIYSLLGLRLEASGEIREMTVPEDPVDLSEYKAIIVDEGSMINQQLMDAIRKTADEYKIKFLFMGDPAQLPPVKELTSPIWQLANGAQLTKVMRHDNQILELVTRIRKQVDAFSPAVKLESNHSETEGVWKLAGQNFTNAIIKHALAGQFSKANGSKVIAWRNVEVDRFNKLIRENIFDSPEPQWIIGDRVLFTAPARDLEDEPLAHTDDEGEVTRIEDEYHPLYEGCKCFRVSITLDDNRTVVARVLNPESLHEYTRILNAKAETAKANPRRWKDFWKFKDDFHQLRHAYAITAHRAQGSTYDTAFVFWQDILLNRNRQEAYRCLYVACSRPKRMLVLS